MTNYRSKTCLITLLVAAFMRSAGALSLEGTLWADVARDAGVEPAVLVAISLQESGRKHAGGWSPSPHAVGTPAGAVFAPSRDDARAVLSRWNHDGRLDVGLMQINLRYHGHRVTSPDDLLDPTINLRVAGTILGETIRACGGDLWCGVGRYHSRDPERGRRYSASVQSIFLALKTWREHRNADRDPDRR